MNTHTGCHGVGHHLCVTNTSLLLFNERSVINDKKCIHSLKFCPFFRITEMHLNEDGLYMSQADALIQGDLQ